MLLAGWAVSCFAIALAGTWLARRYALRAALLDHPGERRSHAVPTPRGGGIAIVAAVAPMLAALCLGDAALRTVFVPISLGWLLVAAIGWYDDHRPLSAALRLGVHALAAGLLAWALHVEGEGAGVVVAGFIAALVLVNVWNFMDGIDGLAASQALVAALAYALFAGTGPVPWLAVGLAAGCAGFLPFNLPRARIFLGDVGSGALGYLLAVLAVSCVPAAGWERAPMLLLPLLAFGVDAALTLGRRVLRGERWWEPHVQHAYQVQARRRGHGPVAAGYLAFTVAAAGAMVAGRNAPANAMMGATAAGLLLACGAWWYLQRGRPGRPGRGNEG